MPDLPVLQDRRELKLRKKLHRQVEERSVEFVVVEAEFNISTKAANSPGGGPFFEGYASVKNSFDAYRDRIKDGAYRDSLKQKGPRFDKKAGKIRSKIKSLWQHNPDWPFGLPHEAEEDSTGLYHKTKVSDTPENLTRLQYMEDTVVEGQSIGFVTLDYKWLEEEDDEDEFWPGRDLLKLDIWEWSPVTFGAHSDALTTLITRNRELYDAVRAADHARTLEFASKMKDVTVPAVEEAISVMSRFVDLAKSQQAEDEGEPETEEEVESRDDKTNPIAEGETSEEDTEFVKRLESFAFESKAALWMQETRTRR